MLDIQSLSVEIEDIPILNDLSLTITAGQLLHLKGCNGAGKTTLLRAIAGLSPISAGTISVNPLISKGYIGHKLAIEPLLTVEENLKYLIIEQSKPVAIEQILDQVQLRTHRYQMAYQLSQGQKKRLSLARFFAMKKDLWLLDEPFNALDINYQHFLKQALTEHIKQGGSLILTSHNELAWPGIEFREFVL